MGRASAIIFGSNAVLTVLSILSITVVARALGPTRLGEYATAWAVFNLFAIFTNFGTDTIFIRQLSARPQDRERILGTAVALRIALMFVAFLGVVLWILFTRPPASLAWLAILASSAYLLSPVGASALLLQSELRFAIIARVQIAVAMVTTAAVAVAAVSGADVFTIVGIELVGRVASVVYLAREVHRSVAFRVTPDARAARQVLWLALPLGLSGLLTMGLGRVLLLLAEASGGAAAAGVFSAAQRIVEAANLLPVAVLTAAFPLMAATAAADPTTFAQRNTRLFRLLLAFILPVAGLLALLPDLALRVFFGTEFLHAAPTLAVMACGLLFAVGNQALSQALVAAEQQGAVIAAAAVSAGVTVGLAAILVGPMGIEGIAIASSVGFAVWLPYALAARRSRPIGRVYLQVVSRVLLVATPFLAALALYDRPLLWRMAAGTLAFATYVVLAWRTRLVTREEVGSMVAMLRRERGAG